MRLDSEDQVYCPALVLASNSVYSTELYMYEAVHGDPVVGPVGRLTIGLEATI